MYLTNRFYFDGYWFCWLSECNDSLRLRRTPLFSPRFPNWLNFSLTPFYYLALLIRQGREFNYRRRKDPLTQLMPITFSRISPGAVSDRLAIYHWDKWAERSESDDQMARGDERSIRRERRPMCEVRCSNYCGGKDNGRPIHAEKWSGLSEKREARIESQQSRWAL